MSATEQIEQIEQAAAELEEAAQQATRRGMRASGACLRNRAAGLRQALRILSLATPPFPASALEAAEI